MKDDPPGARWGCRLPRCLGHLRVRAALLALVVVSALGTARAGELEQAVPGEDDGRSLVLGQRHLELVPLETDEASWKLVVTRARHAEAEASTTPDPVFEQHLDAGCGFRWALLGPPGGRRGPAFVLGRHCFYLVDAKAKAVHGPFAPAFRGLGDDSQSGMLTDLRMLAGTDVLVGHSVDSGPFVFLMDTLEAPIEVAPLYAPAYTTQSALFAVPSGRRGKVDLLWAREEGWGITQARVLAEGASGAATSQLQSTEKGRLAAVRKGPRERPADWLVVDMETGVEVALPGEVEWTDEAVSALLRTLEE